MSILLSQFNIVLGLRSICLQQGAAAKLDVKGAPPDKDFALVASATTSPLVQYDGRDCADASVVIGSREGIFSLGGSSRLSLFNGIAQSLGSGLLQVARGATSNVELLFLVLAMITMWR